MSKWDTAATTVEDAEVVIPVSVELEIVSETGLIERAVDIATDQERPPLLNNMMTIQYELVLVFRYTTLVDYSLTVILAGRLQSLQFE